MRHDNSTTEPEQGPWMPEDMTGRFNHRGRAEAISLTGIAARLRELRIEEHRHGASAATRAERATLARTERAIQSRDITDLRQEYARQQESLAPLPEGYTYDTSIVMSPDELARLMETAGWNTTNHEKIEKIIDYLGLDNFNVGVRSDTGELVGYGRLLYQDDKGELCDFVVSPHHQGKGLGKAILDTRLAMAEKSGIASLYIPRLAATNTLASYYTEKGFSETPEGNLVRGAHPTSMTGM